MRGRVSMMAAGAIWALALMASMTSMAWSRALVLDSPVDCQAPGCGVQNHVDDDPGPGVRDHACGARAYDGHQGTDFRLPNLAAMRAGATVRAAAAGVVARVRDGMPDISIHAPGAPSVQGREAGNAVVIDHGDGWETQYNHLRQGGVMVKPGDRVTVGQPIGLVGLSGNTEFPHLDFMVRHQGRVLDPYVGEGGAVVCDAAGHSSVKRALWSAKAARMVAYQPVAPLAIGWADTAPVAERVGEDGYAGLTVTPQTPLLAFWGHVMGGRAGDRVTITITDPDGARLARADGILPRDFALFLVATQVPRPATGWRAGVHLGRLTLTRGAITPLRIENRLIMPRD